MFTNSVGMQFVEIPAGDFLMGSPTSEAGDFDLQHTVRITRPFRLGIYPATQEQFETVMGTNPSGFSPTGGHATHVEGRDTSNHPVDAVTWHEAVEFCRRLSALPEERQAGRLYRLPTEAEWEYACRAGSTTRYYFGDDDSQLAEYAWFGKMDGTHPVGQKKPNVWGFYDMHGNVCECCNDWWGEDYYANSPTDDPTGPESGTARIVRGGCWIYGAWKCRSSSRSCFRPFDRFNEIGFRVALTVPNE